MLPHPGWNTVVPAAGGILRIYQALEDRIANTPVRLTNIAFQNITNLSQILGVPIEQRLGIMRNMAGRIVQAKQRSKRPGDENHIRALHLTGSDIPGVSAGFQTASLIILAGFKAVAIHPLSIILCLPVLHVRTYQNHVEISKTILGIFAHVDFTAQAGSVPPWISTSPPTSYAAGMKAPSSSIHCARGRCSLLLHCPAGSSVPESRAACICLT